ncbi:hypothetical protein SAMN05216289_10374 [Dokdonella immobilis]|uniref:Uncharacterized protein n=2 Tax=Dokdonella immobilis TaxID=578942 RepID=A0A1I4VVF4_9GAMM|nr:hypothetical protein SAMN05216289_10374 [Dokdonella immobilis]
MEPAQIVAQAKATVAVIDELRERLSNLHPHIDCWANDVLYQSQSTFLHALNLRIDPDLLRIRAAIDHAGRIVGAKKVRTGPKQTELAMAKESLADALRENSEPRMPKKDARALSGELLGLCGLHSKRKPRPKHPDPRKRRQ